MWNPEEDKILLELYEKYGPNWQNISFYLKNRSGKYIESCCYYVFTVHCVNSSMKI